MITFLKQILKEKLANYKDIEKEIDNAL